MNNALADLRRAATKINYKRQAETIVRKPRALGNIIKQVGDG